jgi:hypothetical protein
MKPTCSFLKPIVLSFLLAIPYSGFPQKTSHNLVRIETPKFEKIHFDENYIYITMDFNNAETRNRVKLIDPKKIESISLVYSQYRASERFNQLALNDERTAKLFELMPSLKGQKHIQWYWIAQTDCHSPDACKQFFHGFEIRLKNEEDIALTAYENSMIDYYTNLHLDPEKLEKHIDSLAYKRKDELIKVCDTTYESFGKRRNKLGYFKPKYYNSDKRFARKLKRSGIEVNSTIELVVDHRRKLVSSSGIDKDQEAAFYHILRSAYHLNTTRLGGDKKTDRFTLKVTQNRWGKVKDMDIFTEPLDSAFNSIPFEAYTEDYRQVVHCEYVDTTIKTPRGPVVVYDDVVTKVFDRNKEWKNCLVVTDVTGSMYPYLGQFLAWHKLNLNNRHTNKDFVFFNDGNNMRDMLKIPGRVGGTYYVQTTDFGLLQHHCKKAQRKGSGGDGPENNVEAAIYGLSVNPNVREIIMVVDNWATPRDVKLISKVNKPIHFVLCGATNGINTAYLNLARENGGTVHTIEQDLKELAKLQENERLTIGNQTFVIENGRFIEALPKGGS